MKISELREKDTGSLQAMEKELADSLFTARLQHKTGQLENTAKISLNRKELARIKTVLRARELGLEVVEGGATPKKADAKPNHDGKTQVARAAKPGKPAHAKTSKKSKPAQKPAAKAKASKPAAKAKTKTAAKSAKASGKSGKKK